MILSNFLYATSASAAHALETVIIFCRLMFICAFLVLKPGDHMFLLFLRKNVDVFLSNCSVCWKILNFFNFYPLIFQNYRFYFSSSDYCLFPWWSNVRFLLQQCSNEQMNKNEQVLWLVGYISTAHKQLFEMTPFGFEWLTCSENTSWIAFCAVMSRDPLSDAPSAITCSFEHFCFRLVKAVLSFHFDRACSFELSNAMAFACISDIINTL